MSELQWYEVSPPRDVDLATVTAMIRSLADRGPTGLFGSAPSVIFELWGVGGQIRWLLGIDVRLTGQVPTQLQAHIPRLGLTSLTSPPRPALTLAGDVGVTSVANPLRLDTADDISRELQTTLQSLSSHEVGVVQWQLGPSRRRHATPPPAQPTLPELLALKPPAKASPGAKRLWAAKMAEPLLAVRGRIGAGAATPARAYAICRALAGGLKLANSPHAGLRLGKTSNGRARSLTKAAVPLTWSVVNAAELSSLLGWPVQDQVSDQLPTTGGHVSPAPERLLVPADHPARHAGDRLLGESLHPTQRGERVQVPVDTSLRHLHVIGPTGSGKSTLLCGLISADIAAGRGALVLEPRGDLVQDVLARIPAHRRDDVVVVDPSREDRVVGLNVLAGERVQAEWRADQIVALLAELHGANWGPRTGDIGYHALVAVSRLKDGTLCDVPALLTNPAFRRNVLAQVSDPLVLSPFFAGFDALSEAERAQHVAPLLNKLRPFLSRDALRRMLGQASPRFDIEEIFTKRRIVLINLNSGALGSPAADLLGALILNLFWHAAQRRASLPPAQRHPVMVVIDEVQRFLHVPGIEIGDLFAQCRGLGISLTVAHQHLDQLNTAQRTGILANARSRVVFRPSTKDSKELATALGGGLNGEDLLRLRAYQACCSLTVDNTPTPPFSIQTQPLPPWTSNPDDLRRLSAQRYGVDGAEVDHQLTARWQSGQNAASGPIGVRPRRSP